MKKNSYFGNTIAQVTRDGNIQNQVVLDSLVELFPRNAAVGISSSNTMSKIFPVSQSLPGKSIFIRSKVSSSHERIRMVNKRIFSAMTNSTLQRDRKSTR